MTQAAQLASYGSNNIGLSFKNRLINGAGQIWQRGTTISSIPTTGTSATYGPDRWCFSCANTGFSAVAQAVQVSNGGIRINCTTSGTPSNTGDVFGLRQIIEGLNCYDLAGQQITVSFQVKTNKTGNYGVFLYDYTGSAYGTPQSITVSSSGVTTSYSLTFTAPSSITASTSSGLGFNITLAANASRAGNWYPSAGSQANLMDSTSNYFEIYNIQLEKGSTATSFDYRPYGTELALCQRYYQSSSTYIPTFPSSSNSGTQYYSCIFPFAVTMRATPTVAGLGQSQTPSAGGIVAYNTNFRVDVAVPTPSSGFNYANGFTSTAEL